MREKFGLVGEDPSQAVELVPIFSYDSTHDTLTRESTAEIAKGLCDIENLAAAQSMSAALKEAMGDEGIRQSLGLVSAGVEGSAATEESKVDQVSAREGGAKGEGR